MEEIIIISSIVAVVLTIVLLVMFVKLCSNVKRIADKIAPPLEQPTDGEERSEQDNSSTARYFSR